MKNNLEYLLSRHYLIKIVEAKAISYAEFDKIDELNKKRFLYIEESKQSKDVISSNNVST